MDFASLEIQAVIMHTVPRRNSDVAPFYSGIASPLTLPLKNYIGLRITRSLAARSKYYAVVFDADTTSRVPDLIRGHFVNTNQFVDNSKAIAEHLYNAQGAVNSEGLVCVVACRIDDKPALAILKLENEQGITTHRTTVEGFETLQLDSVEGLTLTDTTRVYKAGFFVLDGEAGGDAPVKARVSDPQSGGTTLSQVSHFFLSDFLGCRLADEPKVGTKRFFDAAETFINRFVMEPQTKAKYHLGLLADLRSNSTHIQPKSFAENILEVADRKPFEDFMKQKLAFSTVQKDTGFIQAQLEQVVYQFEEGALLIATPSIIGKTIRIERDAKGEPLCTILDRLQNVGGGGARKARPPKIPKLKAAKIEKPEDSAIEDAKKH